MRVTGCFRENFIFVARGLAYLGLSPNENMIFLFWWGPWGLDEIWRVVLARRKS